MYEYAEMSYHSSLSSSVKLPESSRENHGGDSNILNEMNSAAEKIIVITFLL
jgi:hypothetical protein